MTIEIGAPACLPLGLVNLQHEAGTRRCLLGITLQHPPVHLSAEPSSVLDVTGARADKAYKQATYFMQQQDLSMPARIEIELAIPTMLGLGSEAMLGLSVAQSIAHINEIPESQQTTTAVAQALGFGSKQALETWAYARGGLILVEAETQQDAPTELVERREIAHPERDAWAFVMVFPRIPDGLPETFEQDRMAALMKAASGLDPESGTVATDDLLPAIDNNDIQGFGRSLLELHRMNLDALAQAGAPLEIPDESQKVLELMQDHGAIAWGQCLAGLCVYGLVHGGQASQELRTKIRHHLGFFGGRVMATITDNAGARSTVKDS